MDAETLTTIELFEGVPDEELDTCVALFADCDVLVGTSLSRAADFSYRFFVILKGEVEVLRDGASALRLGAGGCFGQTGMAADPPRDTWVRATRRTRVATVLAWDFRQLREGAPTVCERIDSVVEPRRSLATR